jgi:hypothetical protein
MTKMGAQSRSAITCHLLVQSDMSRAWLYKRQSTLSLLPHTTLFPSLFGWAGSSSSSLSMASSPPPLLHHQAQQWWPSSLPLQWWCLPPSLPPLSLLQQQVLTAPLLSSSSLPKPWSSSRWARPCVFPAIDAQEQQPPSAVTWCLEVEADYMCQWQVGPGRMWVCWKFQIYVLCSKNHILSLITPKIVKFILLASLWNGLTIGSIGWHVLVEKFFCRNSYLKTGLENKRTCFSP